MELQKAENHKKRREDICILAAIIVIVAAVLAMNRWKPISYTMYTSDSISYAKGVVTQVLSEDLEQEEGSGGRYLGVQELKVKLKNGSLKGQTITVSNELSAGHNVLAGVGQNLIIKVDTPEGLEPFYSVFNYDRTTGILIFLGAFAALMIGVGGRKGIRSMAGLAFALFLILCFLLPAIYHGYSPVLMGMVTAVVIAVISMLLLNGFSGKTAAAVGAATIGTVAAAILYSIFSALLHLTGYNLEQAEELVIVHQNTGLNVGQILFTGILIASLGAVMDMTMSIASSLFEMKEIHPEMDAGDIIRSGMNIGKDMIGTMCQTLILAFAGTGITALLVLIAYGAQVDQLLSSDYVAVELMHSLTGSMAVILSVPVTAICCAAVIKKKEKSR